MNEEVSNEVFEWEGKPIDFGEKNDDWYWALGIVAVAAIIVCVLFNNILLALVILTGTLALVLETKKAPRIHKFRLAPEGIHIDDVLYPYDKIYSFSVLEYLDPTLPPALSIKTRLLLSSHLVIPILDHNPDIIYAYLEQHIPEGDHHAHMLDRFIERLSL